MCTLLLPPTGKFGGPLSPRRKGEHSGFRLADLEFHYTPTHASWLNMVEIEIGVLMRQCLDRRIPDCEALTHEVGAWERMRNAEGARVRWMFDIRKAREKLRHAYPTPALELPKEAA